MRFRIYHAWLAQVPDGTAAEELPSLAAGYDHAVSTLSLEVPPGTPECIGRLACRGRLFEEGLTANDSISFIQKEDV